MPQDVSARRALFAFRSVSFTYFAYGGLFGTYAPLWFQSLGISVFAIGALASMQSVSRIVSPYVWGWLADHSGDRIRWLKIAIGSALLVSLGFFVANGHVWIGAVSVLLFVCTAGVTPISEAALAHLVSRNGTLDAARYGRVRLWGSLGFVLVVSTAGFVLQRLGVGWFPMLASGLLALLLWSALCLPAQHEAPHARAERAPGTWSVLRQPVVAWFFGGLFFTVLAHVSLYAFLSLYLKSLGYGQGAIGVIWVVGVIVEIGWFWWQGRWLNRLSMHGWLLLAALVSALRFAVVALWGQHAWLLVLSQCCHGITFAAQHTGCIALINDYFPGRQRGRGQALYTVIGYGASGVVGGLAGGALSEAFGFEAVFWAASGCAVLAALCCWRALRLHRAAS